MSTTYIINNIYRRPLPVYDPLHPPRTVSANRFSYDPIHPDALEIIQKLIQAQSEGAVREVVWEYFGKYFGAEIMGDEWDSLKFNLLDLWKWYGR